MSEKQRLLCQDIMERIQRIENFVSHGRDAFEQSVMIQDAIILGFIVIGEATKNLDESLTERHRHIPWKRVAGFRDVLVHQYRRTRLELVWRTAHEELPALKAAVTALPQDLDENKAGA